MNPQMSDWSFITAWIPWKLQPALGLLVLGLSAVLAQYLTHWLLTRALQGRRQRAEGMPAVLLHPSVLRRTAQIAPWLLVYAGVPAVPDLNPTIASAISNLAAALIVLFVTRVILKALDVALDTHDADPLMYERVQTRSIKAYVQSAQLIVVIVAVVIIVAALADKSPLIVLSGFGALSAVLLLVFQDTIRSLVAGLLIERNDMLRLGDWVEVPQAGADGEVIDIALNTVKVQNWDKTIVTIPTWRLMDGSFTNWRGMRESGGRRIKRALVLDARSIRFLQDTDIEHLGQIALIADYVREKNSARRISYELQRRELGDVLAGVPVNQRRLTNIGTFRAYVLAYLRAHSDVHPDMAQMVRLMEPGSQGVPLEVYCFARTIAWTEYEAIQSDIFDHLLAVLPEFGLRAYQRSSDFSAQPFADEAGPREP